MSKIIKKSIEYKDKRSISYLSQHAIMDKEGNVIDETYSKNNSFDQVKSSCVMTKDKAGFHNSIFRGKDITSKYLDGSLYTSISNGTFDDLYVGDYFTANINGSNVTCRIAGFDMYYNKGNASINKFHHSVIVPDEPLMTAPMNDTNTTSGGYANSKMHTTTIPIIDGYLTNTFGNHLKSTNTLLSKYVADTLTSMGCDGFPGATNNWSWYTVKSCLMSEVEVYGTTTIGSTSGFDVGFNNIQFPLFKLAPQFINTGRYSWWLKGVASTTFFAYVNGVGDATSGAASGRIRVRPFWLIG